MILPINPLILEKIDNLDIPTKIKEILNEALNAEDQMNILHETKNFKENIVKILEKFADDEEVRRFCKDYESD